jgi:hypothetical protein
MLDVTITRLPPSCPGLPGWRLCIEHWRNTPPCSASACPAKSTIYSPTESRAAALAQTVGLPHEAESIVVSRSPIGSITFVRACGSKTPSEVMRKVQEFMDYYPLELKQRLHGHLSARSGFSDPKVQRGPVRTFLQPHC